MVKLKDNDRMPSRIEQIFDERKNLFIKKNKNYSNSYIKTGEIIDLILEYDNDPLIIIAGDHGPWGYRLKEDRDNNVIPDSVCALDRFGVLLTIRFPEDYQRQFDNKFKTHVNLFRYVFAYLSNSNKILENKAKDDSYDFGPMLAIVNGKFLSKFLPIRLNTKKLSFEK